jgi:hypothetical protein
MSLAKCTAMEERLTVQIEGLEAAVLLARKAHKREFGKLLTRVEALEAAAAKEKKARTDLETTTKEKLDSLETRDPPEQATLVATSVKAMILKDETFSPARAGR